MSDNKRYYWIKLKTDFFNQETIDFMLSQKNGCEYVVLYQMLCLGSANSNGELTSKVGEMLVPYDVEKIVRDTKYFDFDTVSVALELFKRLGLIYEEKDKVLKISNFNEMVGSEVSSAKRVREFRERKKALQGNTNVTQEIEYRDKSIDIDIDNKEENNIIICSPPPKVGKTLSVYEQEFDELWKQYPKKTGKKDALRHYIVARQKNTTYEQVLKGIENYNNYIKKNKIEERYIKGGSSWFCEELWNNEYIIESSQKNNNLVDIFDKYDKE